MGELLAYLHPLHHKIKIIIYVSRDVDLVMTFPYEIDERRKKNVLFQVAFLLKKVQLTSHTTVISHARVPIVTFKTHERYGLCFINILTIDLHRYRFKVLSASTSV